MSSWAAPIAIGCRHAANFACVLLALLSCAGLHAQTSKPSGAGADAQMASSNLNKRTTAAITRGVKYLLSKQSADGSWSEASDSDDHCGTTALVTLALLSCGEEHTSPPIDRAIKFLKKAQPAKSIYATYSTALRACVYAALPEPLRKAELPADLRWLQNQIIKDGERKGMYDYGERRFPAGDYSNSQYGVLGVWYSALAGLEVPRSYWKTVEDGWRGGQNEDGGFGYRPKEDAYASMTAAGAATLYITSDFLHGRDGEDLNKPIANAPLEAAVQWLGKNFAVEGNTGKDSTDAPAGFMAGPGGFYIHYMLFGYERVGEISGLTRFGTHRWFDEGADFLIRTQAYDGSWTGMIGPDGDTAYSLLFLSRGQAPIVMQKLQFDGRWNNRPRDVSGFSYFMRRATERHVNWQIVSIDDSQDDLRQSPLLYAASDHALKFNAAQTQKLKSFIDQGGLLVCCNEGHAPDFSQSIEKLAAQMFPQFTWRDLPHDHPIYTANFPVTVPAEPLRGLSNGLRELIVLYPTSDMSWKWQLNNGAFQPRNSPYASLANLHLYVTDRANPRQRGEETWVERNPGVQPTNTAKVARVRYDGNWDPEPAGWVRLANVMANLDNVQLTTDTSGAFGNATIAHLTATNSFKIAPAVQVALQNYAASGGLLLLDAAGGSSEAGTALESCLHELFPTATIAPLPLDHPIYQAAAFGGTKIDAVQYRRTRDLSPSNIPRLRAVTFDGKLVAILSNEDLTGGLVGYTTAGLTGYRPQSATDIVTNLILWRLHARQ